MKRGDSPETELTNARTPDRGWPCRLASQPGKTGELVWIVEVKREGTQRVLLDGNGNQYRDDGRGGLVPIVKED